MTVWSVLLLSTYLFGVSVDKPDRPIANTVYFKNNQGLWNEERRYLPTITMAIASSLLCSVGLLCMYLYLVNRKEIYLPMQILYLYCKNIINSHCSHQFNNNKNNFGF